LGNSRGHRIGEKAELKTPQPSAGPATEIHNEGGEKIETGCSAGGKTKSGVSEKI